MKSLGKRVREFRKAPGRDWSSQRMADEVGTSRQNIENLEAKGFGQPRYIAALARVMGTTVEDLLGKDADEAAPHSASDTPRATELPRVFEITTTDWGHLEAYKDMSDDDAAFIRAETERRHQAYKKLREEMFAKAGVPLSDQKLGHQLPMAPRTAPAPGSVLVKVVPPRPAPPATRRPSSRYVATDKVTESATPAPHRKATKK